MLPHFGCMSTRVFPIVRSDSICPFVMFWWMRIPYSKNSHLSTTSWKCLCLLYAEKTTGISILAGIEIFAPHKSLSWQRWNNGSDRFFKCHSMLSNFCAGSFQIQKLTATIIWTGRTGGNGRYVKKRWKPKIWKREMSAQWARHTEAVKASSVPVKPGHLSPVKCDTLLLDIQTHTLFHHCMLLICERKHLKH